MKTIDENYLKEIIRDVPDFPKEGIIFKDITPVLQNADAFRFVVDKLYDEFKDKKIDYIVGIESRGFIFSPALAYKMNIGFIPVRKKGKLPADTEEVAYDLEYGQAVLEIHRDALPAGSKVAVVDDLLATGGTARATAKLVEKLGGKVEKMAFLVELLFLNGKKALSDYDIYSLIQY